MARHARRLTLFLCPALLQVLCGVQVCSATSAQGERQHHQYVIAHRYSNHQSVCLCVCVSVWLCGCVCLPACPCLYQGMCLCGCPLPLSRPRVSGCPSLPRSMSMSVSTCVSACLFLSFSLSLSLPPKRTCTRFITGNRLSCCKMLIVHIFPCCPCHRLLRPSEGANILLHEGNRSLPSLAISLSLSLALAPSLPLSLSPSPL